MAKEKSTALPKALLVGFLVVLVWSGIRPHDYPTWALEVGPAVVGCVVLLLTYRRFPLTQLAYLCISLHAIILLIGGHYTYAEVPLFSWIRDEFGMARNHYDRLGHIAQGFFPAIVAREILVRTSPVKRGGWLYFFVVCICLSISAFYELLEWWVALVSEEAAAAFLGTQGDSWDTQWDMFLALCGVNAALLLLAKRHDQALAHFK